MPAKLIFYKEPKTGEATFNFCPLVSVGCAKCFLPPACNGESDTRVAFDMFLVGDPTDLQDTFSMLSYRMKPAEEQYA